MRATAGNSSAHKISTQRRRRSARSSTGIDATGGLGSINAMANSRGAVKHRCDEPPTQGNANVRAARVLANRANGATPATKSQHAPERTLNHADTPTARNLAAHGRPRRRLRVARGELIAPAADHAK